MTTPWVPATIDEIDDDWLTTALSIPGVVVRDHTTERIGLPYGMASEVHRIGIAADATPTRSVVVKLWATDTSAGTGEVEFYRRFGDHPGIRVPRCHHGAVDLDRERGVLVLEDLREARQGDATTTMGAADREAVVTSVARMHARWWGDDAPAGLPLRSHLPSMGELGFAAARRREYVERFGEVGDTPLGRLLADGERALAQGESLLADAPPTLLHGDLHLDNILFVDGAPCLLDWTRAGTGPGVRSLVNLAFLMSPPGRHHEVIDMYAAALATAGIAYESEDLVRHVGAALVRAVMVWTLGVVRWEPADGREQTLIDLSRSHAASACDTWTAHHPDWPFD